MMRRMEEKRSRVKKQQTTIWHEAAEKMKRQGRGGMEEKKRVREKGLWRRGSPLSGTQEACQGLNDITLHVIYLMALGGCLMCQEMHKNPDCYSYPSPELTHKHTHLTLEVWHQTKDA